MLLGYLKCIFKMYLLKVIVKTNCLQNQLMTSKYHTHFSSKDTITGRHAVWRIYWATILYGLNMVIKLEVTMENISNRIFYGYIPQRSEWTEIKYLCLGLNTLENGPDFTKHIHISIIIYTCYKSVFPIFKDFY